MGEKLQREIRKQRNQPPQRKLRKVWWNNWIINILMFLLPEKNIV